MKKVVLAFALFVGLISLNGMPVIGNEKNLKALATPEKIEQVVQKQNLSRHSLTTKQIKQMPWLRYVAK